MSNPPAPNQSVTRPAPRPARSRSWLWFYALLIVCGVAAVTIPIAYNLSQQLRPEQLRAAQERWKSREPADYDLEYEEKHDRNPQADSYLVMVRGRRVAVVFDFANHEVLMAREQVAPFAALGLPLRAGVTRVVPQEKLQETYSVEAMFRTMEANLERNAASGGRNFATASFGARDGHPTRYVYRVKGTPERLEWLVRLTPVVP